MQAQLRDLLRRHPRLVAAGAVVVVVVVGAAVGLAIGAFGARPTADASPIPSASASPSAAAGPPTQTASPAASPASTPATSSSASFNVLPGQQPTGFVSQITCSGSIGASDPVAIVQLHETVEGTGAVVLRDYADPGSPRTACNFGQNGVAQLIDARHVVIEGHAYGGTYAVVDLPEVRFHWFQLPPSGPDWPSTFLAVSPGLDQVLWLEADVAGGTDKVHITTSARDQVVASLPDQHGGRCGSQDDSKQGAYTRSGAHLFVLDQQSINSLLVVEGETVVLSLVPPSAGWPPGGHPAMAVWSPTSETLFYRQGGDVWQWTPAGGTQQYLPGVTWYFPTITPDGSHLAYSVGRPDGLHDVYLVDLARGGSPQLIGEARNLPVFVNSTQLWYKSEGQGVCGHGSDVPLIYNITDGTESPSIIDWVRHVWPATSSNY